MVSFFTRGTDQAETTQKDLLRHPFRHARQFFLAFAMRLTAARRMLYAGAVLLFAIGLIDGLTPDPGEPLWDTGTFKLLLAFGLIHLILLLEVADRLTLKHELNVARDIQRAMLPAGTLTVGSIEAHGDTQPANTVGGDFYDILPRTDGQVLVILGDVAGKGTPAALLMALFLAMTRTLLDEELPPAVLALRLNEQLMRHAPRSRFITAFIALCDPRTGDVRYANAGQNPPMLRRASGRLEWLAPTGMALGLTRKATYEEASLDARAWRRAPGLQRRHHGSRVARRRVVRRRGIAGARRPDGRPARRPARPPRHRRRQGPHRRHRPLRRPDGARLPSPDRRRADRRYQGRDAPPERPRRRTARRAVPTISQAAVGRPACPERSRGGEGGPHPVPGFRLPVPGSQNRSRIDLCPSFTMRACAGFLIVASLWWAPPAAAQQADPVAELLVRMEQALNAGGDASVVGPLFATDAEATQADTLASESARSRTTRAVVRERDRQPLADGGTRVIADVLVETANAARVSTWRFDVAPSPAARPARSDPHRRAPQRRGRSGPPRAVGEAVCGARSAHPRRRPRDRDSVRRGLRRRGPRAPDGRRRPGRRRGHVFATPGVREGPVAAPQRRRGAPHARLATVPAGESVRCGAAPHA